MNARLSHPMHQGQVLRNLDPAQGQVFPNLEPGRSDLRKRDTGSGGSGNPESPSCARAYVHMSTRDQEFSDYPTLLTLPTSKRQLEAA